MIWIILDQGQKQRNKKEQLKQLRTNKGVSQSGFELSRLSQPWHQGRGQAHPFGCTGSARLLGED